MVESREERKKTRKIMKDEHNEEGKRKWRKVEMNNTRQKT